MEAKGPFQPPANQQPVVFKSANSTGGGGLSFSSKTVKTGLAAIVMLLLVGGVGTGVYLVGQKQQLSSKASTPTASTAPIPSPLASITTVPSTPSATASGNLVIPSPPSDIQS